MAALVIILLIALSTLISEDLACVGAGLMAAKGIISYGDAALAAFIGIFIGDLLLYALGRYVARPAMKRVPFKWIFREQAIRQSSEWFTERGPMVILLSRFLPGSRFPTYVAAGSAHELLAVHAVLLRRRARSGRRCWSGCRWPWAGGCCSSSRSTSSTRPAR